MALSQSQTHTFLVTDENRYGWSQTMVHIEKGIDSSSSLFLLQRADDSLVLSVEPDTLKVGQFITEGTKKAENPLECTENALQVEASVCRLTLPQEGAGFFDIDNEAFEAMPVEVKLLPRKLRFFCSSERRDQLAQMD